MVETGKSCPQQSLRSRNDRSGSSRAAYQERNAPEAVSADTKKLIKQAREERERLSRHIEESRETIERCTALLAQINRMLAGLSRE